MITDANQLRLPIEILEGSVVVLVCLNVRVVHGKAEVPAVHKDVLEDIGVSTSRRDSVWGKARDSFHRPQAVRDNLHPPLQCGVDFIHAEEYQMNRHET